MSGRNYHIAGNFQGGNLSQIKANRESFSTKFGGMACFGGTSKQSMKVFLTKILFSINSQKLSYLLYGMYTIPNCQCVDRAPDACSLSCTVNEGGQLPMMLTNKLIVYFFVSL